MTGESIFMSARFSAASFLLINTAFRFRALPPLTAA
jgi:hypothetical protein